MNVIAISGNLTAAPDLRTTASGVAVCSFTVAVRRPFVKDTTDFINCVAWRNNAEFVSKHFAKGQRIEVDGCLITENYTDKDGNKRTAYKLQCANVGFGDRKQAGESTSAPTYAAPSFSSDVAVDLDTDEDLPF